MKNENNIDLSWNINFGSMDVEYQIEQDFYYSEYEIEYEKSNLQSKLLSEPSRDVFISSENVNDYISITKVRGKKNKYQIISELNGCVFYDIFDRKKLADYILCYIQYSSNPKKYLKKRGLRK